MTGETSAQHVKTGQTAHTAQTGRSGNETRSSRNYTRQFSVSVYTQKDLEMKGTTKVADIAYSAWFLNITILIIVCNAIWMLIDVEWNHVNLRGADGRTPLETLGIVMENLFCSYFTAEILLRLIAFKSWIFMFKDAWFIFDFLLVILMVVETWILPVINLFDDSLNSNALNQISMIRLFRLLRLGRIFRMLRFHPELRLLVKSIARAMDAVFYILFLLVLVTYFFAIVFTTQLAVPGTERASPFDDPNAQQLFSDIGSSMMSLFTYGTLADEMAFCCNAISQESIALFWLFTLFVVFSCITLLNMLIGVLCQVVEDNSQEHSKQKMLVDLKTSLEEAFEALDTSHDGKISEEEFKKMRTDPNVLDIFFRLGMDQDAMVQRLNHMQETIFHNPKQEEGGEGLESEGPPRSSSLSFKQFCDEVIEMQMGSACGVLDVQLLAAKVRSEDSKLRNQLIRLEPELKKLLEDDQGIQGQPPQEKVHTNQSILQQSSSNCEDSMNSSSVRRPPTPMAEAPALQSMPEGEEEPIPFELPGEMQPEAKDSFGSGLGLMESWLKEVPTELLLYTLKSRAGPEMIP